MLSARTVARPTVVRGVSGLAQDSEESSSTEPTLLVISAHAADFVWRSGGAVAATTARGGRAHVVCLTFGERGESQGLWAQPGATEASVKARRREQCLAAAEVLGATIEFVDAGDYPLRPTEVVYDRVVEALRTVQPDRILTHPRSDPYNLDHALTYEIVLRARMIAQAAGHDRRTRPIGAVQVLQFEPHQPEQCGFRPDLLFDITDVFDRKVTAMTAMEEAQGHLVDYYRDLAGRRGVQARRNGAAATVRYAEAFERVFPTVGAEL